MGSRVSSNKNSFGIKSDKFVVPIAAGDAPMAGFSTKSPSNPLTTLPDIGSKDDRFFDSQPWLDSDCDDDFMSVNGDLTPSIGSSPVHRNIPVVIATHGSKPEHEPLPKEKKKRLSDLFQESLRSNYEFDAESNSDTQSPAALDEKDRTAKTADGTTPYASSVTSLGSSERSMKPGKEKPSWSAQCCLPSLMTSRSYTERKRRTNSTRSIG